MSASNQAGMEAAAGHESQVPKGGDSVDCLVGLDLWNQVGMQAIDTAPRDGTEILLLVRHANYALASAQDREQWQAWETGKWIDHNGGGWTWHGIAGSPVAWIPLPNASADGREE